MKRRKSATGLTIKVKPTISQGPAIAPRTQSELNALTKQEIISELGKSPHGDLKQYEQIGLHAAMNDPFFFSHFLVWNHVKGQVRDAQVALPVLGLATTDDPEYAENALALMADQDPKMFLRAVEFAFKRPGVNQRMLRRLVERYLRELETDKRSVENAILRHKKYLKQLYGQFHIKPHEKVDQALFKGTLRSPRQQALELIKVTSDPVQVAGLISKYKLPLLSLKPILGDRMKNPDILVAVIARMTPQEVLVNVKNLEKLGVKEIPAARAALEEALAKVAGGKTPNRASLFKAEKAAEALEAIGETKLAQQIRVTQEKVIASNAGVEGNWLVLGDKSSSMAGAIEAAKEGASYLARMVKGKVYLVFFDDAPTFYDVTGKTLEEIKKITRGISPSGWTSIGSGLQTIVDKGLQVDGIAVFTDGGENRSPYLYQAYQRYVQKMGNEPTVYFYAVGTYVQTAENGLTRQQIDFQTFKLSGADYYSLPNLIQTMRVGRYGLLDEINSTQLVRLDQVLQKTIGLDVLVKRGVLV